MGYYTPEQILSPTSFLKIRYWQDTYFFFFFKVQMSMCLQPMDSFHSPQSLICFCLVCILFLSAFQFYNLFQLYLSKFPILTRKLYSQPSKTPWSSWKWTANHLNLFLVQQILDGLSLALEQQIRTKNGVWALQKPEANQYLFGQYVTLCRDTTLNQLQSHSAVL